MTTKRISAQAYQALRDALATVVWNKRAFESLLRDALREHPELLAGLNFSDPKRVVTDRLVDHLRANENIYQAVTLQLMLDLASITRFANIEAIKDPADRAMRLGQAEAAVTHLAEVTAPYSELLREQEQMRARQEELRHQDEGRRRFDDEIASLKLRFIELQSSGNPQQRGRDFESLLGDLFRLFDLEPRLAYVTKTEQIDGSLRFDTDDYIVEAKWLAGPASRAAVDAFATKVGFKGKNALGLFVSVNGFTKDALERYSEKTPFIGMDGGDLFLVLDGRVKLDDLLRAKLRHANETGSCYLSAHQFVG